ncbi:hypothetical protein V7138_10445 [Bacillus sp. JJ1533]|uniref:hypothetical protein n=1 Tax=Bacillus sp. JJ1533 TaxID=3122959 RepID=UPI002FFE2F17
MKNFFGLTTILVLGVILVACSGKERQLIRADVQKVNQEGNYEDDVIMITDKEKLDSIKRSLENVIWDPHTKAEMARNEDILATLFYTFDGNMPERLYQYRIWFSVNNATIISNNDNEGYGRILDKEIVSELKENLLN